MSEHEITGSSVQQSLRLTTAEAEALGRLIEVEFRLAKEGMLSTSHSFVRTEVIVVPPDFAVGLERFRGYTVVHAAIEEPVFGISARSAGPL